MGFAVSSVTPQPAQPTLNPRVQMSAIAGLIGLVVSFGVGFFLEYVDAKPLPFLMIVGILGISFGIGLAMRTFYTFNTSLKSQAMILAAIVAAASTIDGVYMSMNLGVSLNASETLRIPAAIALRTILHDGGWLICLMCGLTGAFASRASAPWLFLGVPLALYFVWVIGPMFLSGYIAMTNWDGIQDLDKAPFVGLYNFDWLLHNDNFWTALGNNLKWLAFFLIIPTSMGLALAMIFNGNFIGSRFFKVAFFAPLVIAPTVVALVWEALYRPDIGLINSVLRAIVGPNVELPGWLADRNLVLWCIVIAAAWRQVGYVMILYLAGLKSLDVTLLEAATVDGASPWARFRKVILPLLGPVTVVVLVISVIDSLRAFDLVAIMTRGGPSYASEVLANFMYMRAFNDYRYGFAAATAVILLVIMLFFIIPYLVRVARTELEY